MLLTQCILCPQPVHASMTFMAPPRPLFTVETGTDKPVERKIGHYSLLKDYFECFKFVCSV